MATYEITSSGFDIYDVSTGDTMTCAYTGDETTLALRPGKYQFTITGASGNYGRNSSSANYTTVGGGGSSTGILETLNGMTIYINVGGCGSSYTGTSSSTRTGGYNGGGSSHYWGGVGGGATSVAARSGLLQNLSSYTSDIIIVAGGGGGSAAYSGNSTYYGVGGAGGGTSGVAGTKSGSLNTTYCGQGGTQTAGGAAGTSTTRQGQAGSFGKGGNFTVGSSSYASSAGGGGYYGGGAGSNEEAGGGGGSGYISSTWLTNSSTSQGTSSSTTSNGTVTIEVIKFYDETCDVSLNLSGGTFYSGHSNGILPLERDTESATLVFAPRASGATVVAYENDIDISNRLSYNSGTGRYTLVIGPYSTETAEVRIMCGDVSDNFTISTTGAHVDIDNPEMMVYRGDNFTVNFTPSDTTHYRYLALYDNNVDMTSSVTQSGNVYSYTISNIQGIHQIIIVSEPLPYYDVIVSCSPMGSITNSGVNSVAEGGSLTITCSPQTNYSTYKIFVNSEPVTFSGNSYTVSNVQADTNVYVLFSSGDIGFYFKSDDVNDWVPVQQVYRKSDGRWVAQEFALVGDPNMKYVRKDGQTITKVTQTVRLIPSTSAVSNSTYLSIEDANNMYTNTDSDTYATITNSRTSTTSYYAYLRGFNVGSIPNYATVDSFTVKLKGYQSGCNTGTSYRPQLCNNTTAITNTYANALGTSSNTVTFANSTLTWGQIENYGQNFGIRICVRRSNRNTTAYAYIQGAEIEVTYHYYVVS